MELQLKRLMVLRVVIVTTLLLVAFYVEAVSETVLRGRLLYVLIAATYGLTVLHSLALRFVPQPKLLVFAQVVGDLAVITGLVYATGGTSNRAGFMLLYPLSVLSGSVLLDRRGGLALAGIATSLYLALLTTVRAGWIPPQGLAEAAGMPSTHLFYSVFVAGVACGSVALIGSYLSESLKNVGERLVEAKGQVADLRELNSVIVESIQSGLLTADPDGRTRFINAIGTNILGRAREEVHGRLLREVFASHLFDGAALEARGRDPRLARFELQYRPPDRAIATLGVSLSRLAESSPQGSGYLLVFQDLTEIKRLEEDVRLKERLAAVGEMAARLAHEIRNPLGAISGSAQVLMKGPNFSPEQERLLAIITRESRRLSDALSGFLDGARSSPFRAGPVDLSSVIGDAVELLRNDPQVAARHTVHFRADQRAHVCLADPDRIKQVFWNLARNGLAAMPGGGSLFVELHSARDEVILSLRDEGRAAAEWGRTSEPFHSTTPGGLGLGLVIVYQIVKEHRGDITIRSAPGRGSEVEVRLPAVSVPVPA